MTYRTGVALVLVAGLLWSFMGLAIRQIDVAGTWADPALAVGRDGAGAVCLSSPGPRAAIRSDRCARWAWRA